MSEKIEVACEVAMLCVDPFNAKGGCDFHVRGCGMPRGEKRLRFCKYADLDPALCSHPQAKLLAFRRAVRLELEVLEEQKREGARAELQLHEDRIKNDECPDCGLKLTFTDLGAFTGFDGEARGLRRESVVCQRCKSYGTRIVSKAGKRCPWGELTALAKKGSEE